jgi:hypothetical protein
VRSWLLRLVSLPLLALLVYGSSVSWRAQRYVDRLQSGEIPLQQAEDWVLAWEPSLVAARMMLFRGGFEHSRIRRHLEHALNLRPLYAPAWLDLAELEWRTGNDDLAIEHADHSRALWPTRQRHLWRLGQFYLRLDQLEPAMETLAVYLLTDPGAVPRVLSLLIKLEIPADTIARYLAHPKVDAPERLSVVAQRVMDFAGSIHALELAGAWWAAVGQKRGQVHFQQENEPDPFFAFAGRYIGIGLAERSAETACQGWLSVKPDEPCYNRLRNAGFTEPLSNFGLGWQVTRGNGYQISQPDDDRVDGFGSLQIDFDGSQNLHFRNPRQWLLLQGEGQFVLRTSWRADKVSTRSGVFMEVRVLCPDGDRYFRTEERHGRWDWVDLALPFDVGAGCDLAQVALGRNRTDALDKLISGTVWLDNLAIKTP